MRDGICPKCNSKEVIDGLLLHPTNSQPYVAIVENPQAWLPKSLKSEFIAYVCGTCGYSEFYAVNHQQLADALRRRYAKA